MACLPIINGHQAEALTRVEEDNPPEVVEPTEEDTSKASGGEAVAEALARRTSTPIEEDGEEEGGT